MSTTIDEKIVSMQFDNRNFETNAKTTMSTLDKLKQRLNLSGASKGLEDVNKAANKVDFSQMEYSATRAGFQIQDVWLKTASVLEYQVAGRIIDAGKRIVSALAIDPIKTGLSEYETKINAIQVIKSNTRSKYEDEASQMADIEKKLSELNDYADRTIYNYAQMTNNLGKFVNQGLDLDEATNAVVGLANLAGASGASAEDMARATYQMSQAMGSVIRMQDWRSLMTANMAGEELKNVLSDFARLEGVDIDSMLAEKGTFEKTLEAGWLTGDLFTKAMNVYSDAYSEAELTAMGFTDEQVKNFKELAATAREATTEVKTVSQLWDVLKETAQSGWTQTWELIMGDFDAAKSTFTNLQNFLGGIVQRMSDWRNYLLQIALAFAEPWTAITEKLNTVQEVVNSVTSSIGDIQGIVDDVWLGKFSVRGGDPDRKALLEQLGYNYGFIQELVNLGEQSWQANQRYVLSEEEIAAAAKKHGVSLEEATEAAEVFAGSMENLDDAKLMDLGLTEDEIRLYRALESESKRLGISMEELTNKMSDTGNTDGRTLLIKSLSNIGNMLLGIGQAAKEAWNEIFNPPGVEVLGIRLYGLIDSFHEFTKKLKITETVTNEAGEEVKVFTEFGDKFIRIFRGILAVLDIVLTVVGGPLKIVFKILTQVLGYFGIGILDAAASLGDLLVMFHDWFESLFDISGILDKVVPLVMKGAEAVKTWFNNFKNSKVVKTAAKYLQSFGASLSNWWQGLKTTDNIPKYIAETIGKVIGTLLKSVRDIFGKIRSFVTGGFKELPEFMTSGFMGGLGEGIKKVAKSMLDFGKTILDNIKQALGIHSPSKEMEEVGKYTIEGFIKGVGGALSGVWNILKEFVFGILEFVKDIDLGDIFAIAGAAGLLSFVKTLLDICKGLGNVLWNLGDLLDNTAELITTVKKTIGRLGKAVSNSLNAMAFKQLAISIAILVGSIVVLTLLDPKKMWIAVGVLGALAAIMAGLFAVVNGFGSKKNPLKDKRTVIEFGKMATGILAIAASIMIMALAARMIGNMDTPTLIKAGIGIVVLAGIMVGLMAATKLLAKTEKGNMSTGLANAGKMLLSVAAAILVLVVAAKMIAKMSWDEMARAGVGLLFLAGIMVGLMAATKLLTKTEKGNLSTGIEKTGKMLLSIAAAILVLVIAAKMIAKMEWSEMGKAAVGLLFLGGIMVGLMAATKLVAKGDIKAIGTMLLSIAAGILLLVIAAKMIAGMEWGEMLKAGVGIVVLAGIMVGLVAATRLAGGNDLKGVAATILAMALAIGIMAAAAVLLSFIDPAALYSGVGAIAALGLVMAVMVASTKNAKDCKSNLIVMTAAIAIMAAALIVLSFIEHKKLMSAMVALGTVMGMFAVIIKSTKNATKDIGALIVMTVAIAVIAGAIYLLAKLPIQNVLGSAIALSVLMLALAATMKIISTVKSVKLTAIATLAVLIIGLYAIVEALALMDGLQNAEKNAIVLGALMAVLSALTLVIALAGVIIAATGGMALLGLAALAGILVSLYAIVGALAIMDGLQNVEKNIALLSTLMSELTKMMVVLAIVGPLALIGVTALAALSGLILAFGVIAVAIGALTEKFPQLQTFLDTGIPMLVQMAGGLGQMIGAFIANLAGEVMNILPQLGLCLSQFMTNATGFIVGAKMVDSSVLAGAGYLAGAVVALTVAELINGIATLLPCVGSLADLGLQLSLFMANATPFIIGARMMDQTVVGGVKALAETILILTAANVIDGLTSWLTGGSSLENFAEQLPILGDGLSRFSESLEGFGPDQVPVVAAAAQAVKSLAEASKTIPNSGGWLGKIVGENDLGVFADQFPNLGAGLAGFLTSCGDFSPEKAPLITAAADAVKSFADAAKNIPNSGGWVGKVFGENDLGTFADQFPKLGEGLAGFVKACNGGDAGSFTDADIPLVTAGADAVKTLASAAKEIPTSGGWISKIIGESGSLENFAGQFPKLGEGLVGFMNACRGENGSGGFSEADEPTVSAAATTVSALARAASLISGNWATALFGNATDDDLKRFASAFPYVGEGLAKFAEKLGTFDYDKLQTVNTAVNALQAITYLSELNLQMFSGNFSEFGTVCKTLGTDISTFCTNLPGKATLEQALAKVNDILGLSKTIAEYDLTPMTSLSDVFKTLGESVVKAFTSAFSTEATYLDLKTAGETLINKVYAAAKNNLNIIGPTYATSKMYDIGKAVCEGFADGIELYTYIVETASRSMAEAAVTAAKEEIDSHSPSRVFRALGTSVPEGFAMGIGMLGGVVKDSAVSMADTAINGTKSAIAHISDAINSDIDAQPTIRPVLDLSDVTAGASAIGGLFNSPRLALANVGTINSMMSDRQNGVTNSDVVSAIKDLGNLLSGKTGDTYLINGVTYDDGSNITEAVKTLVRAARVERRI